MSNIEKAKELKEKALRILKNKRIPSALNWLMKEDFGKTPMVVIDKSLTNDSIKDCKSLKRFKFNNHSYELIFENEHFFSTPDGGETWGDFRLLFDGEEVFKTKYDSNYCKDEWSFPYDKIMFHECVVETLKLKEWIDDLPELVKQERIIKKQDEKLRREELQEKEAEKTLQSIDLGKFRDTSTGVKTTKKNPRNHDKPLSPLWVDQKDTRCNKKGTSFFGWVSSGLKILGKFFLIIIVLAVGLMWIGGSRGCGKNVETSPSKILPKLKQAQRCCDGRCSGPYQGVPRSVACADVTQMESCLEGHKDLCPIKGYGAF